VGPSRANLFTNLQPFVAVLLALVLLSESLNRWEVVGAIGIAAAIAVERFFRRASPQVAAE
jgi:drug/metabolite transporter (DMT)-like permease